MERKFKIQFLDEANEFLNSLDEKVREKVIYNIWKSQIVTDKELFKKLQDEIWEFRTLFKKSHIRLFAFWDKSGTVDKVVVANHGIIKKTGKTPKGEIEKAERIRKEYFEQKNEAYEN